jgi:hypothetical protein
MMCVCLVFVMSLLSNGMVLLRTEEVLLHYSTRVNQGTSFVLPVHNREVQEVVCAVKRF